MKKKQRKKKKTGEPKYIFPNFLAQIMSKVDMRTQYEASMLSMSLIGAGLVVSVFYFVLYFSFPVWYKVVLVINGLAGLGFMWSFITTTYQQYRTYMIALNFQYNQKGGGHDVKKEKEVRRRRV